MFLRIVIALMLLGALPANAAQSPKEGTATYTTAYIAKVLSTMQLGNRTVALYELHGISKNDAGQPMFNDTGARCLGMREVVGGVVSAQGDCVDTDKDGDQIFTTFTLKAGKGVHTYIGGTGKYSGITGTADFTSQIVRSPDDHGMVLVTHKAHWVLK